MNEGIRMQVSAFVDGELPENEAELLLRRMSQDVELRREVAEYLAIGRLMRAEPGLAGADRLHEQIAAAIDDRPADAGDSADATSASRAVRPLAGIAIAATVALVAIFVLQQTTGVDELPAEATLPAVADVVPNIDAQQERQRQYFLNHAETSSQFGANGMNSRLVTLRFSEDVTPESEVDESDGADGPIELDKTSEMTTQP
jgi:sigma-E factor negative regulatory protein RseA